MIKHILVPIDGSDHAWKALDIACTLAAGDNSRLSVICVVTDASLTDAERRFAETEFPEEMGRTLDASTISETTGQRVLQRAGEVANSLRHTIAGGLLDRAKAQAHENGIATPETAIVEGDPAEEILAFSKNGGVDAIIMGSRGLGALKGLLMGSVSQKVSAHAECSCMTVK